MVDCGPCSDRDGDWVWGFLLSTLAELHRCFSMLMQRPLSRKFRFEFLHPTRPTDSIRLHPIHPISEESSMGLMQALLSERCSQKRERHSQSKEVFRSAGFGPYVNRISTRNVNTLWKTQGINLVIRRFAGNNNQNA